VRAGVCTKAAVWRTPVGAKFRVAAEQLGKDGRLFGIFHGPVLLVDPCEDGFEHGVNLYVVYDLEKQLSAGLQLHLLKQVECIDIVMILE